MARKYKVLHLVDSLDRVGGLEKIAAEIVTHLNIDVFEAEIWCVHKGGAFAKELRERGVEVRVLNIASYYDPRNILALAKLFRDAKADIIHTHVYFAATIGRIAGKLAGVKVLINHVHSSYWHYNARNLFIERFLSRFTQKIICVSNSVRDFVERQEGIDPSKVQVIYNGITWGEAPLRPKARSTFHVKPQEIVITTVASLTANKGHKILIEALSLLKDPKIEVKCWIVGDGPMESELRTYARQMNVETKLTFWGTRQDIPMILAASDIFVLPSIEREGLPVSVMEAMACGVPVIASKIGGLPEIVKDHKSGLMVKPKDPADLAKAIEDLIADEAQRALFAREGQKRFQESFDSKIMVGAVECLYREHL